MKKEKYMSKVNTIDDIMCVYYIQNYYLCTHSTHYYNKYINGVILYFWHMNFCNSPWDDPFR